MKQSTGEANMTVITVVLIGIVASLGAVLIPNMLKHSKLKSCCGSAGGSWQNNTCNEVSGIEFDIKYYEECEK